MTNPIEVAASLPVGFALIAKVTATCEGVVERTHVLSTRAPESGRFGRRIANVTDLDARRMAPFPDAPYSAVATLIDAGWSIE